MAFDGITIACITNELKETLQNGRIFKIAQPENDELILTVKVNKEQFRLLISANASLPLVYLTNTNKQSPLTAPSFCMLLRKHINNGRITNICQPGLERVINIEIEHLNEMGDLCKKVLIIELMGKHSNIIFCDDKNKIIDSIKHITAQTSSVREVLPGREYFIPQTTMKCNPLDVQYEDFRQILTNKSSPLTKSLYNSLTGISPIVSEDILHLSGIDSSLPAGELNEDEMYHLYNTFTHYISKIKDRSFSPVIYYSEQNEPLEYSAIPLSVYFSDCEKSYPSMSRVLETYYAEKNTISRIRQRSADLRQIVNTALAKSVKKYDLQLKQLKDTEKRDKYKVYGELLTTYGYNLSPDEKVLTCTNYYDGKEISIPLDTELTPMENAKKYFDKYGKLKRTYEALTNITKDTKREMEHLESISTALDMATSEVDLKEIKEELIQFGYIRRKSSDKKAKFVSKPLHVSLPDGYEIYIGKNNYQNEEVTFKIATGNDWWFHAKKLPGSHVIVRSENSELPDKIYEIAGSLAAYYSKGREQEKVEIDYTQKKNLKRVNGAAPGFVIYHTNYSMMCPPKSPDDLGLN
ncbi:MAG: NFACT family protein [Lachnospiraceae bacterium]|nr:NFACT family protein [Lachnospiraceae bacterium]